MIQFLLPLVLLANGLAAGVLIGSVMGPVALLRGLAPDQYVRAHALFASRYDPFMPICLLTTALSGAATALAAPAPAARALFTVAALLATSVIVISLTKNVPINRWVRSLDPDELPANWEKLDPRARWRSWNLVRAVLAVGALGLNVTAVAVLV